MDTKAAPRVFYKLFSIILLVSLLLSSAGTSAPTSVRAQEATTEPPPAEPTGTPTVQVATPEGPTATETLTAPLATPAAPFTSTGTSSPTEADLTATFDIESFIEPDAVDLTLSANPIHVESGDAVEIVWSLRNAQVDTKSLSLRFSLGLGLDAEPAAEGTYDQVTRTLELSVATIEGVVPMRVGASIEDATLKASLWDGQKLLTTGYLSLKGFEKFSARPDGSALEAMRGDVKITFPAGALQEAARVDVRVPSADALPSGSLSGRPFEIVATGETSNADLASFGQDIELEVSYAGLNVPAGAGSGDLFVYWYDPGRDAWLALDSWVDVESRTIHAKTNHFTVFDIGVNNWQASHVPTVDGFQVSGFTGAARYSMPIEVPPGPGGFQPSLQLSYNSQVVDQATTGSQASWAGMGWSLDFGSIERDIHGTTSNTADDTYLLNLNGVSGRLVQDTDGAYGGHLWHTADEQFWGIVSGNSTSPWAIWDKRGNVYYFEDVATMVYNDGGVQQLAYKWGLSRARNIHGQEMDYTYDYRVKSISNVDSVTAMYPRFIVYSNERYRVRLSREPRTDYPDEWNDDAVHHSYEKERLIAITIEQDADGNGTFETIVRRYEFTHVNGDPANQIFSGFTYSAGGKVSTLSQVQQFGLGGTNSLPAITFEYSDHLHLTRAENGYGGAVEFTYDAIPYYDPDHVRASQTVTVDFGASGLPCNGTDPAPWVARGGVGTVACDMQRLSVGGNAAATAPDYEKDMLRPGGMYRVTAGITLDPNVMFVLGVNDGTSDYAGGFYTQSGTATWLLKLPATASKAQMILVALASPPDDAFVADAKLELLPSIYRVTQKRLYTSPTASAYAFNYSYAGAAFNTPANGDSTCPAGFPNSCYFEAGSEFRGHSQVTETGPDGRTTVTTYHQDAARRGRQASMTVKNGSGVKAVESITTYASVELASPIGYADLKRWWVKTTAEESRTYDSSGSSYVASNADYGYASAAAYGNLISVTESSWSGSSRTAYRSKTTDFFPNVTYNSGTIAFTKYLAGLPARQQVKNGSGVVLSETLDLYDGASTYTTSPTVGKPSATRTWVSGTDYSQTTFGYDAWGNITSVIAYSGYGTASAAPSTGARTTSSAYETEYHTYATSITDALSHITTLAYDYSKSVPLSEVDANSRTTTATYDDFGRMTSLTRPLDASPTLTFAYDDSNPFTTTITQRVDASTNFTIVRKYDGLGRQYQQIAGGVTTDLAYDAYGRVTTQSTPYQAEAHYNATTSYDVLGRPLAATAPDGNSATFSYNGLSTTKTDARGYATTTLSDVWGRVTSVTPPSGPDYGYDGYAKALLHTNGTDGATTFTDESGKTWTRTGNAQIDTGQAKFGGASGLFDGSGDYLSTNDHPDFEPGSGNFSIDFYVRFNGTIAGQPFFNKMKPPGAGGPYQYWASMPNANTFQFAYSTDGSALSYVNFTWSPAVDTWYHVELTRSGSSMYLFVNGTQTGGTQAITGTIHDGSPQLQIGNIWGWNYLNGWIDEFRFSKGIARHTSNFTPPSREYSGLPTSPGVTYTYNELGQLKTVVRGGVTTTLNYDNAGRKTSMTDPDMGAWQYGYDALGNLTSQTDARSCALTLGYDLVSRLTSKNSSGSGCGTQVSTTYGYDSGTNGIGHRTSMSDASGSSSWTYDDRGRMVSESKSISGGGTFATAWAYNSADLMTTLTYPGGEAVSYTYDARMLVDTLSGTSNYVTDTQYDSAGRTTSRTLGNGLTTSFAHYAWNEQVGGLGQGGRLHTLTTGSVQNLSYTYDKGGNITQIVDAHGSETSTYAYDGLGRLSDWTLTGGIAESYIYDPTSGNLVNKAGVAYTYNSGHAHAVSSRSDGSSYQYDANGNMTQRVVNGFTYNLSYDAENRMVAVSGDTAAWFLYDGDGQRVKQTMDGITTYFVGNIYQSASGVATKYYYTGASRVAMRVNGTLYYLLSDHLGSTTVTTDVNGNAMDELKYKPWGEVRAGSAPTNYTFTGQYSNTSDFGLMYYNARWYDVDLGRMASADSVVPAGLQGYDRYAYSNNNPVNYTDPTGHFGKHNDEKSDYWNRQNQERVKRLHDKWDSDRRLQDTLAELFRNASKEATLDPTLWAGAAGGRVLPRSQLPYTHDYTVTTVVCAAALHCSREQMLSYLLLFAYPGQDHGKPVVDGKEYYVGIPWTTLNFGRYGSIIVQTSPADLRIQNITLEDHRFYWGIADRWLTQGSDGSWSVTTHSYGYNRYAGMAEVNQVAGKPIFMALDAEMQLYIETHQ